MWSAGPAVRPQEGDESHGTDVTSLDRLAAPGQEREDLLVPLAERYHESASVGELLEQRRGHLGAAGAHENRVVGCILAPADRSVAHEQGDVPHTRLAAHITRALDQR